VGGARPPSFTKSTITYKDVLYAPAERADVQIVHSLCFFLLIPLYELCVFCKCRLWRGFVGQCLACSESSCNPVRARDKSKPRRPALIGVLPSLLGGEGRRGGMICTVMEPATGAGAAQLRATINLSVYRKKRFCTQQSP
jgi:hypothetical protein